MEALYAKLYDRYTTLKKKKYSELDEVNREQEVKFLHFVSASEDLTQHLRSENQNLKVIVERLRDEITEIRSTREEELVESQKRLVEEERKNKALSEQVEKLKELISEGVPHNYKDQSGRKRDKSTPESSTRVTTRSMRKRSRETEDMVQTTDMVSPTRSMSTRTSRHTEETYMVSPHINIRHKSTTDTLLVSQPQCCKTTDDGSSGCPFQALGEHLIGMNLSSNNEGERDCIIASHPSSGLSFSLTLLNNTTGEEAEMLYKVVSLGTFERVAPEWMRDVIKFNTSMIPVFFERVSRVIKPRG